MSLNTISAAQKPRELRAKAVRWAVPCRAVCVRIHEEKRLRGRHYRDPLRTHPGYERGG